MAWISRLASLKLTLASIFILLVCVTGAYLNESGAGSWLAGPLALLATNLLAAVVSNPHFRRQLPLLVFHLALLAIVLLVALGRMTYLKGKVEVLEGQEFDGQLMSVETGPWHPWGLDDARFVNLGFRVEYAPGRIRRGTENHVAWTDEDGQVHEDAIGDQKPLVRNHYRFYTTPQKGFALLFEWRPKEGAPVLGSVNLPSYPANTLRQAQQWPLPGLAEPVWAMLQFEGDLTFLDGGGDFRLPDNHQVVVRHGDRRWELPGVWSGPPPSIDLPEGRLVYHGLRTWMGYQVAWDRTVPWLLVASVVAVLALGWHFWRKFAAGPWNF